jgi:fimbrial chaperone protein
MQGKLAPNKFILLAAIFFMAAAFSVFSFSFSPMSVSIDPSGPGAVMTYKVTNESDKQLAVSIKVATRVIEIDGTEKNEPADKLFLIFPSRVVLKPNSAQNVKIQYRGTPSLKDEVAYRVIAEQLPVDFTKAQGSGVNILLTYVAALYVTPKNVQHKIEFANAVGAMKDGIPGLSVTIRNAGSLHGLISTPVLKIQTPEATMEFSGDLMREIEGQNLLASSERRFFVPWEASTEGAPYTGSFEAVIE